jgi:hypothetical protein
LKPKVVASGGSRPDNRPLAPRASRREVTGNTRKLARRDPERASNGNRPISDRPGVWLQSVCNGLCVSTDDEETTRLVAEKIIELAGHGMRGATLHATAIKELEARRRKA